MQRVCGSNPHASKGFLGRRRPKYRENYGLTRAEDAGYYRNSPAIFPESPTPEFEPALNGGLAGGDFAF